MKQLTLIPALLLLVPAMAAAQCECPCGDANCDDGLNSGDIVYLMNYLYNGGPPPPMEDPECANWDYALTLTIADVFHSMLYVFSTPPPPEFCPPTGPPIAPQIDSAYTLYYTDWMHSGDGSGVIALTMQKGYDSGIYAMSFPLRIRVDGQIPTIDSVVFADDYFVGYSVYEDSGDVAIGISPLFGYQDWTVRRVAFIHISVPAMPAYRTITVDWVNLTPIQAPTQDSSLIPMILGTYFVGVEPLLQPHCCLVPGDASMDGEVNVADPLYIINCVFKDCLGHDCEKQIDANCDGSWNVGDAVYLVNYIFKFGPAPCCL